MSRLKKNLSLQTIYQIIATITPLITAPYLSRRLGVNALGTYSYTYSIINYFVLLCMLGIINYGTRTIALLNDTNDEQKALSEIYLLQLICCTISVILFLILLIFSKNKYYLILQSLWIFSCFFDVTWYFFGKEKFQITVIRNLIIKVITISLIFLLLKNSHDLWKYITIMSSSALLSQFSLWIIMIKTVSFKGIKKDDVLKHLKPILILFVPILAMSVFHIMDKTMLGLLSDTAQSGYYYNADKIVNIPLCIITGIGTVMLANITTLLGKGNKEKAIQVLKKSIKYIICISTAMAFGIAAISKDFIPVFFGNGYERCIYLIMLLASVVIIKSISDVLRTQYMIPFKKEKYFIIAVIIGSIVNLIANTVLIYYAKLGAVGAAIGTVLAETTVCIIQIVFVNKFEKVFKDIYINLPFLVFGIVMYIAIKALSTVNINLIWRIIIEISTGGIIYLILSTIYLIITKDEITNIITKKLKEGKK